MSFITADRVLETTVAPGTGNVTLGGAVSGYRSFASVATANGDMFTYVIAAGANWETGIGTRLSSTSFSRSVLTSSNGNSLVNFSGTCEVWIDWTHDFISAIGGGDNNMILNSAMAVDQAHNGNLVTGGGYILDQWQVLFTGGPVASGQQNQGGPGTYGSIRDFLRVSVTTAAGALAAGAYLGILQPIEGWRCRGMNMGFTNNNFMSLGFWFRSNLLTGTFGGSITNSALNRSYVFSFTVNTANTFEYKTIIIPQDNTGSWVIDNGTGMNVNIALAVGSTFQTAPGSWVAGNFNGPTGMTNGASSTSNTFDLTGVTLRPGNIPTSERQSNAMMRLFDHELLLCQRYWEKTYDHQTIPGSVTNNGMKFWQYTSSAAITAFGAWNIDWKVRKRAAPTVTYYSPNTGATGKFYDGTSDQNAATSFGPSETGVVWNGTTGTNSTVPQWRIHAVADARL
jgi:hypothetical protein